MNYMNVMNNLIAKSFLNGKVVVERLPKKNYPGMPNILQLMNQVALQENVQVMILSKRNKHKTEEMISLILNGLGRFKQELEETTDFSMKISQHHEEEIEITGSEKQIHNCDI
jgi:hypothetical protein